MIKMSHTLSLSLIFVSFYLFEVKTVYALVYLLAFYHPYLRLISFFFFNTVRGQFHC